MTKSLPGSRPKTDSRPCPAPCAAVRAGVLEAQARDRGDTRALRRHHRRLARRPATSPRRRGSRPACPSRLARRDRGCCRGSAAHSASIVGPRVMIWPPLASPAMRAAVLTASPKTSPRSSSTGPAWKPMRMPSRDRADRRELGDLDLHVDRRLERGVGRLEHRHDFVADGLDDPAAVRGRCSPQDVEDGFDRGERRAIAELFVERSAAADVGEQHRKLRVGAEITPLATLPRAAAGVQAAARSFFCCFCCAALACIDAYAWCAAASASPTCTGKAHVVTAPSRAPPDRA